jgi:multicomponent Na+:H+ antiporter subunit B
MNVLLRQCLAVLTAASLLAILQAAMSDLPPAGGTIAEYGMTLAQLAVSHRNSLNTVSGVLFDFRALDTLGEMLVLFTTSAGLHVFLQQPRVGAERDATPQTTPQQPKLQPVSEAVRGMCLGMLTPLVMYGIYISVRGHLTVGGGFQGGLMVASGAFLLYLAGRSDVQEQISEEEGLDAVEGGVLAGYLVAGLAGLILAGSLFANVLPLGSLDSLLSAGLIPVLSVLVAGEAAAACMLLVSHLQNAPLTHEPEPRQARPEEDSQ